MERREFLSNNRQYITEVHIILLLSMKNSDLPAGYLGISVADHTRDVK